MANFQDGFAGTAGVDLDFGTSGRQATNIASPYAANGGEWTRITGAITLVGSSTDGYVQAGNVADNLYEALMGPAGTDYWAQAIVYLPSGTATGECGICVRLNTANGVTGGAAFLLTYGRPTASLTAGWSLYVKYTWPGGIVQYSQVGFYAAGFAAGATHTIKLQVSGQNPTFLTAWLDGTQIMGFYFDPDNVGETALDGAGQPGIFMQKGTNLQVSQFQTSDVTPAAVSVTIAPTSAPVYEGQTLDFTATVANTSNKAVTWTVQEGGGGTINPTSPAPVPATAVYTAPQTTGTFHVVATSVADNTKSATAVVTVVASNPYNLPGTVVTEATSQAQQLQLRTHRAAMGQENTAELWYGDTSVLAAPVLNVPTGSTGGNLAANTTYYYEVTATTAAGETTASNEESVTTGS